MMDGLKIMVKNKKRQSSIVMQKVPIDKQQAKLKMTLMLNVEK
jgi:hypothetical protein